MNSKKKITLSLLFVLCLGIFMSSASAFVPTAGQAGLDPETGSGTTLTVIAFPSVGGTALANKFGVVRFVIDYDETKLDYDSTTRLSPISTWAGVTPYSATNDATTGRLTVYAEAGLGQTLILGPPNTGASPTSLFTVAFRARSGASGDAVVSIAEARISKTPNSANGITDFAHPSTISITAATDPCAGIICQNGGVCSAGSCACINGYTGTFCATPPVASCTGNDISHSEICTMVVVVEQGEFGEDIVQTIRDDAGLRTSLPKIAVTTCTEALKCEYLCNSGYQPNGGRTDCVQAGATCTAVAATCSQAGVSCPGSTTIAQIVCPAGQNCVAGACLTNQQRLVAEINDIPANDVPPTWTAIFISRMAGILRRVFG